MPRHGVRRVWAGRLLFGALAAALVSYLAVVGLEKADKLASCAGAVLALFALVGPYLLPAPEDVPGAEPDRVEDSGKAEATDGGQAVSGADVTEGGGSARVLRSGHAAAEGAGSTAVTGIVRRPRS